MGDQTRPAGGHIVARDSQGEMKMKSNNDEWPSDGDDQARQGGDDDA